MTTYLERFEAMVEELKAHPKVEVLNYNTFNGITIAQIEAIEETYQITLSDTIKAFYKQTNGLQLRWIFKDNEQFDAVNHTYSPFPVFWNHGYRDYHPEDGSIIILPLQKIFELNWENHIYFDWMTKSKPETFEGREYSLLDFCQKIKPFDVFDRYNDMAFFLDGSATFPVIMGDDHQACYTDSRITDFTSYLEFLIANKGLVKTRKDFYGKYAGHRLVRIQTPQAYWDRKHIDLDTYHLKMIFPDCDRRGANTIGIDTKGMIKSAQNTPPITKDVFQNILIQHHNFLKYGGAGGEWQTILVKKRVAAIYKNRKIKEGQQAIFELQNLSQLSLKKIQLPYANFCGIYAPNMDCSESDLSNSLLTDAFLEESNFENAMLEHCDFSRSTLQNVNFKNANLMGADFENCDLTGADFTGAILENSRFLGAILKGVKY